MGNAPPPASGPVARASTARLELNIGAPPPAAPVVTEPPGPPASSAAVPFPLSEIAPADPNEARSPLPSGVSSILSKICRTCGMRYPAEFRVCPKDASELVDADAPDDELVGQIVADTYTILRVVGEGGMGKVYEARHMRIGGKRFAVKLLHPEYARIPEVQSRFQREAEAAASIESPHVGDVYDIGRTSDGRPFIVAEFLEGRELADLVRERGRLALPYAIRVVRQICRALDAAHRKGIVHRDMKPENVFLVGDLEQPTAKVIDFGISKVTDASGAPSLTKTGMIMGTPSYMAPEQARGDKVDHRVDVYAVGAILYELCTGQRPFDRADPTATIMAVLLEEPERPCVLNPSLPETLELVIQRAMAKSPDARHASMRALEEDLAPFAEATPTVGGASLPPQHAPTVDRREGEVALSRPTILVLGSLGGVFVLFGLMTLAAGAIRLSRGGGATANLTGLESILLVGLLTLALATPAGFVVHLVRKNVWHNSAKTVELAGLLKRAVLAALVSYGLLALTIRFVEALVLRRAAGIAWPVWDVVSVLLASLGAALTHAVLKQQKS
jgi:serine/threonine protein kinase